MSFDASNGTRGSRQPGGLTKFFNRFAIRRVRAGKASMAGMQLLVLNTVGRRSGEPRETPVAWFPGEDDSWVVVASANGATNSPAWYHNLAAHPDQVSIDVGGQRIAVSADQLAGADRDRAWASIVAASPRFADYEQKTDRAIPLIRLRRRDR